MFLEDDLLFICVADDYECWLDRQEQAGGAQQAVGGVPANGYVAEDGVTFYVAEDGATFYVREV